MKYAPAPAAITAKAMDEDPGWEAAARDLLRGLRDALAPTEATE